MKDLGLDSRRRELDRLFALAQRIEKDPRTESELPAHMARYLCIRVAGLLERATVHLFSQHAKRRSAPTVASYAESRLARFQNPKAAPLVELAGAFDRTWASDLEGYIAGARKDAIDSVMNNRHLIAHGESVTLTLSRMKGYYDRIIEVIDFIESKTT